MSAACDPHSHFPATASADRRGTLNAVDVTISGPALPVETCLRRLRGYGVVAKDGVNTGAGDERRVRTVDASGGGPLDVAISWLGPAASDASLPADESTVQAMTGLMQVHGRDAGRPGRLGLDVASVASGVLASQAVLAAALGARRGSTTDAIETSVLEAGLVMTSHYIAAATCPDRAQWPPPRLAADPGPPFRSADGRAFEIETMDPDAFRRFLAHIGADGLDLTQTWALFRARYFRGACTLPPGIHEAMGRLPFADVERIAEDCRVSLVPVRSYNEVVNDRELGGELPELAPLCNRTAPGDRRAPSVSGDGSDRTATALSRAAIALPLEGMIVVEATSRMQGPLAGLLLQLLGARVVRVEPPGGDPIRLVAPYTNDDGYFFATFNHGKESVELDLTCATGPAALLDLVSDADVFLQNWGPGRDDRWGLGAEQLAAVNPRLVYVRATGWGDSAPHGNPIGTDFLVQAHAGMADGLTAVGAPPAPSRVLLTDCLGALVACEGTLAGLLRREQKQTGQVVDTSLLAGATTLQADVVEALRSGTEHGRRGGRPLWGRLDEPLPTSDGYIAVGGGRDADALAPLASACGIDAADACNFDIEDSIAERIAEGPARLWQGVLPAAGIPCASVEADVGCIPADPRFAHLFQQLPGGAYVPRAPWRFAG